MVPKLWFVGFHCVFVVVFVCFWFFGFAWGSISMVDLTPQSGGPARPRWFPNFILLVSLVFVISFLFYFRFLFGTPERRAHPSLGARPGQDGSQTMFVGFPCVCFVCFWLCLVFCFRFDTPGWGPGPAKMVPKLVFFVFSCVCLVCFGFLCFCWFCGPGPASEPDL